MKSKKIIKNIIYLLVAITLIGLIFYRNYGYPQKDKIEEFSMNEKVKTDNFTISAKKSYISGKGDSDYPILSVDFTIENTTDKDLDISDLAYKLSMYQSFDHSDVQNIDLSGSMDIEHMDKVYQTKDLKLAPKEKKDFTFKYYLFKGKNKYKNFIFLDNSYYNDEYLKNLDKGYIMYKTINLGDIYD